LLLCAAIDAEYLVMLFTKRAQEKVAETMTWLAVQRAASGE
jgi:hypothetical protein